MFSVVALKVCSLDQQPWYRMLYPSPTKLETQG